MAVAAALGAASASAKGTVWLCKPGARPDPCTPGLSTTVYNAPLTRAIRVEHPAARRNPPIDCFYVYPTVSDETTGNSDLTIQDTERSIALYQVSRYSQDCRVYAPMYRQVTLAGAGLPGTSGSASKANPALGVADVEAALKTYLTRYNHGRGFVLIGHSQGSGVLEAVIAKMVDTHPAVRRHLLSAILMGGNVLVKGNTGIGGDFKHIPACRGGAQLGCVIAFSPLDQTVPSASLLGPIGHITLAPTPSKAEPVLCQPGNLAGGSGILDPIQPSAPFAGSSSARSWACSSGASPPPRRCTGPHRGPTPRAARTRTAPMSSWSRRATGLRRRRRPRPRSGACTCSTPPCPRATSSTSSPRSPGRTSPAAARSSAQDGRDARVTGVRVEARSRRNRT
jgi:hypothetical protein